MTVSERRVEKNDRGARHRQATQGPTVGADQRVAGGKAWEVNVIFEQHEVADAVVAVKGARGVGDQQDLDAKAAHDAHRQGHGGEVVALVAVDAALHHHHIDTSELANDELARVARN